MRFVRRFAARLIRHCYVTGLQEHRDCLEQARRVEIPETIKYLDRKIAGWNRFLFRLNK